MLSSVGPVIQTASMLSHDVYQLSTTFFDRVASLNEKPLTYPEGLRITAPAQQLVSWLCEDLRPAHSMLDRSPEGIPFLPSNASMQCILDAVRTKRFVQAIESGVPQLLAQFPGKIRILDAGCGYCPILSIAAALVNPRVTVTALESNLASIEGARTIVARLKLDRQITIIEADARTYQPEERVHGVISETMNSGLADEPLVLIMRNLVPHTLPGALLLPSQVTVHAGLITPRQLKESKKILYGYKRLADVRPESLASLTWKAGDPLDIIELSFPRSAVTEDQTSIGIWSVVTLGKRTLQQNESAITRVRTALCMSAVGPIPCMVDVKEAGSEMIKIAYQAGGIPIVHT